MKVNQTRRIALGLIMAVFSLTASSAQALENNGGYTISNVTVRQRWPWDRKVDVDFYLAKPEWASSGMMVSLGVVASNGTDEVTLSTASLSGTTGVLPDGYRRLV